MNSAAQLCLLFDERRDIELEVGRGPQYREVHADVFVLCGYMAALARLEAMRVQPCCCYRALWVN